MRICSCARNYVCACATVKSVSAVYESNMQWQFYVPWSQLPVPAVKTRMLAACTAYKYLLCKSLEFQFLLCFNVGEHASGLARACVLCILIEETSWSTNHAHSHTHIHMHTQTHRSKVDDLKQQVGEVSKKYCFLKVAQTVCMKLRV